MLEAALEILKKIESHGFQAYIVGGFPRDLYIKRKSLDVDICTDATPRELKSIFKNAKLPQEQYGGVTLYVHKYRFEVTTFRRELKYENNRIPVEIEYIHDLKSDLLRRDFTINTLCIDSNGTLFDLLDGKKDIDNQVIKIVGDIDQKLTEDALRILRAIRFATVLDFKIDDSLMNKIYTYGYLLKNISYYRKKEELNKIFVSSNVKYGCELLISLHLTDYLDIGNLNKITLTSDLIGIWAQLDVLGIYNFTAEERDQILMIQQLLNKDVLNKYNLYHYGLYISSIVGDIKNINRKVITKVYNDLPIKSVKDLKVSAMDICEALEVQPGSFLKDLLKDIEKQVLYGNLKNERNELINYIIRG